MRARGSERASGRRRPRDETNKRRPTGEGKGAPRTRRRRASERGATEGERKRVSSGGREEGGRSEAAAAGGERALLLHFQGNERRPRERTSERALWRFLDRRTAASRPSLQPADLGALVRLEDAGGRAGGRVKRARSQIRSLYSLRSDQPFTQKGLSFLF